MIKEVSVLTTDGELKDLKLPLSEQRLDEARSGAHAFNKEEEEIVLKFVRIVHSDACPISKERLCELVGDARTKSFEDQQIAEWILDLWRKIETHRKYI